MTDEEHDALMATRAELADLRLQVEAMTKVLERHDRFFFQEPEGSGRKPLSTEISTFFENLRTGKRGARFAVWLCAALVTVVGAYNLMRGLK